MLAFDFSHPIVILAPMAGYTDAPMREVVSHCGVDAVVSEMMACTEWKSGKPGVENRVVRGHLKCDTTYIVQIAGREPSLIAEAARFAEAAGADQIDINMGCPAKKVISGATAGAALLLEPMLACKIIEATTNATNLPVSVKTRLGWDQKNTKHVVRDFENAGAQMFTIHGRTRQQKYLGAADWHAVGEVRDQSNVPVIVNGDIVDNKSALMALEQSQCDGIMVGRGAIGQPKLPSILRSNLQRVQKSPEMGRNLILWHYERMLEHYGVELGVQCARKHLKAYFGEAPIDWRKALLRESDPEKVIGMIETQACAA